MDEDYRALASGAALADLSDWALYRFSGAGRKKFLNGLLTNDALSLAAGRGQRTLCLTPKGMLLADLDLYEGEDDLLAFMNPASGANFRRAMAQKILLADARMEAPPRPSAVLLLAGPRAAGLAPRLFGGAEAPEPWGRRAASWSGGPADLLGWPRPAAGGILVVARGADPASLMRELTEAGQDAGLRAIGPQALRALRIERGVPEYGVDIDSSTLPPEARLEEAVSYTKGCYMGQETLSRLRHLGHVNRLLARLGLQGGRVPAPGPLLSEGREAGRLTSAAWSPGLGRVLALGMIREELCRPPTTLTLESGAPVEVLPQAT